MLLFLTLTGARVSQDCDLTWADIDWEREQALLRHTKNGSLCDLAPPAMDAISFLRLPNCNPAERVFGYAYRRSVNKAIERACLKAKAPYLSSHRIGRHAFAARLLREGHSLKLVQEAGGWKVARMVSDHYGHLERTQVSAAVKAAGTNLTQKAGATRGQNAQLVETPGGRYRDRTCDPYHVKVVLYR